MKENRLLLLLFLCFTILFGGSCEEQSHYDYPQYLMEFAKVWTDSEGNMQVLQNDFGRRYMVANTTTVAEYPDTVIRVICKYEINPDSTINITEHLMTKSGQATNILEFGPDRVIKRDPIEIISIWKSGGYLNIILSVMAHSQPHTLFVIYEKRGDGVDFTLYHDRNGDLVGYSKRAYLSIPLSELDLKPTDSITFSCRGNEVDYNYSFVY